MAKRMITLMAAAAAFACGPEVSVPEEHAQIADYVIEVRLHGKAPRGYGEAELRPLATVDMPSTRGTKTHKAVPLDGLIAHAAGGAAPPLKQVVVVGEDIALVLEGPSIALLSQVALKFGDNHNSVGPVSDEAFDALRAIMGKPRVKMPSVIYAYPKAVR
jgi:hypothetical protein